MATRESPFIVNLDLNEAADFAKVAQSAFARERFKKVERLIVGEEKNTVKIDPFSEHFGTDIPVPLKAYLYFSRALQGGGSSDKNHQVDLYRIAWARMMEARVFSFPGHVFQQLYNAADIFTTQTFGGVKWAHAMEPPVDDFDQVAFVQNIEKHGAVVPMPEEMPFKNIFITHDEPIKLSEIQVYGRMGREPQDPHEHYYHGGYLITQEEMVVEFIIGIDLDENNRAIRTVVFEPIVREYDLRAMDPNGNLVVGAWDRPFSLNPWICTSYVELIKSYRTFVVEYPRQLSTRRNYEKSTKKFSIKRPVPPPYYTVRLQNQLIVEHLHSRFPKRTSVQFGHRWDVSGHDRIRIRRGKMPIDPNLERILLRRGYKLFTATPPDFESWRLLAERHMEPKRPNEWLAIKRTWVNSYTKGPEDAPYIPAIRKPTGL